jgi:pSer/pThr/pTyr-binding forkhead associated (FHA) protein
MNEKHPKDDIYKARIFRVAKSGVITEEKEEERTEKRSAVIVLPDGMEIPVGPLRIFGREDFQYCLTKEKALLISRNHFQVYRHGFRFFIEDGAAGKPSTNGTKVNGREIKGRNRVILRTGAEILIANILKVIVRIERE